MKRKLRVSLLLLGVWLGVLLLLTGCDMNKPPPGGELTEWALRKASGALEDFSEAAPVYGGGAEEIETDLSIGAPQ